MGSPVQFPIVTINPLRPSTGPTSVQFGSGVLSQVALLSQQVTDPQQMAMILNEWIQGLQDQIRTINQLLSQAPTVSSVNLPQTLAGPNGILSVSVLWTSNSPSAGSFSWGGGTVIYNGTTYSISAGNTNMFFVYWQLSNPTVFQASSSYPAIGPDDFIVALNGSNNAGTAGIYTPDLELHNANNDRILLYPTAVRIYDSAGHQPASINRTNETVPSGAITLNTGAASIVSLGATGGEGLLELFNNVDSAEVFAFAAPGLGGELFVYRTDGIVGFGVIAGNGSQTSATAGTHGALPAQVAGYYTVTIDGSNQKIPYYNV